MIRLLIPEPQTEEERRAIEWWRALMPETRLAFLQAAWELEGCETPDDLEPHQRNPRYRSSYCKERA